MILNTFALLAFVNFLWLLLLLIGFRHRTSLVIVYVLVLTVSHELFLHHVGKARNVQVSAFTAAEPERVKIDGFKLIPNVGIYLMISEGSGKRPELIELPWSEETAKRLQESAQQAEQAYGQAEGHMEMQQPFNGDQNYKDKIGVEDFPRSAEEKLRRHVR